MRITWIIIGIRARVSFNPFAHEREYIYLCMLKLKYAFKFARNHYYIKSVYREFL